MVCRILFGILKWCWLMMILLILLNVVVRMVSVCLIIGMVFFCVFIIRVIRLVWCRVMKVLWLFSRVGVLSNIILFGWVGLLLICMCMLFFFSRWCSCLMMKVMFLLWCVEVRFRVRFFFSMCV